MKFYKFLGVNTETNKACVLFCLLDFDSLIGQELEARAFNHESTNWCGRDDLSRTIELKGFKPTGRKLDLAPPMVFHGTDYDCGHNYNWRFSVNQIWEV